MKKLLLLILLLSFTIKAQEIKIGTQTWTSKNLEVTKYRNGDVIPQVVQDTTWASLTTGAWCYYENKAENGTIYGKLYNWYAVNDPRGLAPKGYHIPTDAEWTILTDYLGGDTIAGTKMKSTSGWDNNGNGTNTKTSGFSGLPGGSRYTNGRFNKYSDYGDTGIWWSSSEYEYDYDHTDIETIEPTSWCLRSMLNERGEAFRDRGTEREGYSVRCLRD